VAGEVPVADDVPVTGEVPVAGAVAVAGEIAEHDADSPAITHRVATEAIRPRAGPPRSSRMSGPWYAHGQIDREMATRPQAESRLTTDAERAK
jgi:hypothetical protein